MHSVIILTLFSPWFTYPEISNIHGKTIDHKIFFDYSVYLKHHLLYLMLASYTLHEDLHAFLFAS
jgi:hypothetical protein